MHLPVTPTEVDHEDPAGAGLVKQVQPVAGLGTKPDDEFAEILYSALSPHTELSWLLVPHLNTDMTSPSSSLLPLSPSYSPPA